MAEGADVGGRTRTALVTGGTGGMGRAIAAKLAADGYDIGLAYIGSADLADAIVGSIEGRVGRGLPSRPTSATRGGG